MEYTANKMLSNSLSRSPDLGEIIKYPYQMEEEEKIADKDDQAEFNASVSRLSLDVS